MKSPAQSRLRDILKILGVDSSDHHEDALEAARKAASALIELEETKAVLREGGELSRVDHLPTTARALFAAVEEGERRIAEAHETMFAYAGRLAKALGWGTGSVRFHLDSVVDAAEIHLRRWHDEVTRCREEATLVVKERDTALDRIRAAETHLGDLLDVEAPLEDLVRACIAPRDALATNEQVQALVEPEIDRTKAQSEPIPLLLTCPHCATRHIDKGEYATKPHRTHACQHCGCLWRPANVPTVGVLFLPGTKD